MYDDLFQKENKTCILKNNSFKMRTFPNRQRCAELSINEKNRANMNRSQKLIFDKRMASKNGIG